MKFNRKLIALLIILVLSLFSLTACNNSTETKVNQNSDLAVPAEINFGILRVPNDETLAIAENYFDKYFTDQGIKVNTTVFDSGVEANQALASGSIDFATMGNTNAITALARNLKVEMIWIHEVLGEIEALAVKNDSDINKIEDLKGKRIAVPFASTSHYILLNVLKEAGIENDVQLLDMQTAEIVAAWERGDIKAAYTWQPSLGKLLESGHVLISSKEMAEQGYITANVEVVRQQFAQQYPDLVADYIKAMTEAGNLYRNDPEQAAEIVAAELGIEKTTALHQMEGSSWKTPQELLSADFFGSSETPGAFARIMKDTSDFLQAQDSIDNSPTQAEFNQYVNPHYIELSLNKNSSN